jgi:predicted RND superfamily exporter protein
VLSSIIVPLIVVLAIADDVHIMQHFEHERRHGGGRGAGAPGSSPEQAFKRSVRHLLAPLLGASGTTALGMLSLATSNVVSVRQFGIGSAVGVMVDFAISIVFMPTLLAWLKPEQAVAPHETWLVGPMRRVARLSTARPRRVLLVSTAVLAATSAGATLLKVDTNHVNFFAKDHPLGVSAEIIDRELAGIYSFQIMLEGPPDSMKSPDTLRRMERLGEDISRLPFVKKVTSPADYVKRINRELHGGHRDAAIVPGDPNLIAQELFLFAMSDDGRAELERVVSSDFSSSQMSIKFASMSSDVVFEQIGRSEVLAEKAFAGTGIRTTATGAGKLFSTLDHYLVVSQISSFGTAFVTVFGVIFLVFRSARFGLLAIVPNLFPVVAVLGLMGWLGISLNVATIMVASVALGIVDDDTIHFINRFRRETAAGAAIDEAIETATIFEGRASLTTAFINTCAYATVMLSSYKPTAWFGGLLALTMAVAFLAEVFVLPATIKMAPKLFAPRAVRAEAA